MPSNPRRGLTRLLILTSLALFVSGCVSAPPILSTPTACSTLLPSDWLAGVPGAPIPQGDTVGSWMAFADAQTGQLDKANSRYAEAVGIVERCEARDREAIKKARPKFLGVF